jgi:acetyl esterase
MRRGARSRVRRSWLEIAPTAAVGFCRNPPARGDIAAAGRHAVRVAARFDPLHHGYAAALGDAGTHVDLRSTRSLTHGIANVFPLGGGSAVATTELISALRAHLSRV